MAVLTLVAAAMTLTSAMAESPSGLERQLKLRSSAEVWSQTICLNDLVEDGWIQGRCAVERTFCCLWSMNGVLERAIRRVELQRELSQKSFGGIRLILDGPEEVRVRQTRRELTTAELKERLQAGASSKYGDDSKIVAISNVRLPAPIFVALDNESAWEVNLPEQPQEHLKAKVIATDSGSNLLGWVQASMRVESEVYVAKKTLRPGDLILDENFELRRANLLSSHLSGNVPLSKGQMPEAVRARTTILAGAPLTSAAIERIPLVKLGDTVTLILRADNLRISTKAVVQSSAAIGDMVTVQLSRYNRTFRGRLIDGRLVEVWL